MANNPYYNYSGSFLPGALDRAETLATEFQAVQAGFAELDVEGVDSGIANSYVVTTTGGYPGTLIDGVVVAFKPLNANSAASTINVNNTGVLNLKRGNGTALQAGDLAANMWYQIVYASAFNTWFVVMPASYSSSGTVVVSGSAPINKVGLTSAGGVSTNVVPIDATYAIDQTMTPIWTGIHTFNAGIRGTGASVITAPSGQYAIQLNVGTNAGGLFISASNGTGATPIQVNGPLSGTGTAVIILNNTGTTGTCTASLSATNKPGSTTRTTPAVWLPVQLDGTAYDIPCYARG